MTAIYSSAALKTRQREIKDIARKDVVHITENGNAAFVFMSEELFEQAYNFIKGLDISQLHVFSYSERPGTRALSIEGAVSPAEKHRRSRMLIELSEEKRIAFYERYIGKEAVVLFEKPRPSMPMGGFTANYIRVECEPVKEYVNTLVRVRLGGFNSDKSALTVDEIIGVE